MRVYVENVGESPASPLHGAAFGPRPDGSIYLSLTPAEAKAIEVAIMTEEARAGNASEEPKDLVLRFDHPNYEAISVPHAHSQLDGKKARELFESMKKRARSVFGFDVVHDITLSLPEKKD